MEQAGRDTGHSGMCSTEGVQETLWSLNTGVKIRPTLADAAALQKGARHGGSLGALLCLGHSLRCLNLTCLEASLEGAHGADSTLLPVPGAFVCGSGDLTAGHALLVKVYFPCDLMSYPVY